MVARVVAAVFLCGGVLGACVQTARGDETIELNEEYKGKTVAEKVKRYQVLTSESVFVNLRAGQKLEITAKMFGDNRGGSIVVWDSDNQPVYFSSAPFAAAGGGGRAENVRANNIGDAQHQVVMTPRTARIQINEMSGTGKYKITVYSHTAGAYTLLVREAGKKRDVATVEKELKAAKRLVEDLEDELKSIKKEK